MSTESQTKAYEDYRERRRSGTAENIQRCATKEDLENLLAAREILAEVYAEDGARDTASCIREIDLPMIREALNAHA